MSKFKVGDFVKRIPALRAGFSLGHGAQRVVATNYFNNLRLDGNYAWFDHEHFEPATKQEIRESGLCPCGESAGCGRATELGSGGGEYFQERCGTCAVGTCFWSECACTSCLYLKAQAEAKKVTFSRDGEGKITGGKVTVPSTGPKFEAGDWVTPLPHSLMNGHGPFEVRSVGTMDGATTLNLKDVPFQFGYNWDATNFRLATRQEKIELHVPEIHTETVTTEPEMNDTNLEDSRDDWEDLSLGTQFDKAVRGPIGEGNDMNFFVNGVRVTPEEYAETIRKAKVAEESPLLYDRITGAGPFIRVHTDMDEDNRGQVCVYAGNRKAKKSRKHIQAREWVWPQTLTPQTPEPKEGTVTKAFHDGRVKYLNGLRRADWDQEAKTSRRALKAEGKLRIYNGLLAGVLLAVAAIGVGELVFQTMNPEPLKTSSFGPAQGSGSKVIEVGGEAYRVPSVDPGITYYAEDGLLKMGFEPGDSDVTYYAEDGLLKMRAGGFEPGDSSTPVVLSDDKELTFPNAPDAGLLHSVYSADGEDTHLRGECEYCR